MMKFTKQTAWAYVGGLSEPSKMPCYSYSISAKTCKTGSKLHKQKNTVCSLCYAMRGHYPFPNVQASHARRLASISQPYWVEAMATAISTSESSGHFRWNDSGDLQSLGHLIKVCEIAKRLPNIKFWLPTREAGILRAYKKAGFSFPKNLTIRFSAARFEERPPEDLLAELGIQGSNVSKTTWTCPSDKQDNQCLSCRKCWDQKVKVVTYKHH